MTDKEQKLIPNPYPNPFPSCLELKASGLDSGSSPALIRAVAAKKGPRPTDVSTSFQDWEEADQPSQPQTGGYDRPNKRGGRRQNPPTQPRAEPAGQRSKQPSRQAPPQPESEEDEPEMSDED